MTRDNNQRSGAPVGALTQGASAPEEGASQPQKGAVFSFSVPSEFVDLPSKGQFYPEGHPLHGVSEVEIRHMTAKEEDILTNAALIKKGLAIDRMLQNIILTPGVRVDDLLSGDKNALTVAARITGFGPEYGTRVTCPACAETNEFSFDLNLLEPMEAASVEGVEKTDRGTFVINGLPRCDFPVEVKLLTGRDEAALSKSLDQKRKHNMLSSAVTDQLKMILVSVNNNSEAKTINDFVESMPLTTTKKLRAIYKSITPNLDMIQDFSCPNCGHEEEMEVPFGIEFFWPKQ